MLTTEIMLFPPLSHFVAWKKEGHWTIQGAENYQKSSFRSKYNILMSNGLHTLSIPLESGKHQNLPIQEVKISYVENWQKIHLQTLQTAYGKTPFFEDYFPEIEQLIKKKHLFLWDKNLEIIQYLVHILEWQPPYSISDSFLPYSNPKSDIPIPNYYNIHQKNISNCVNISILDAIFNVGNEVGVRI